MYKYNLFAKQPSSSIAKYRKNVKACNRFVVSYFNFVNTGRALLRPVLLNLPQKNKSVLEAGGHF
jgi:hypothetical protein